MGARSFFALRFTAESLVDKTNGLPDLYLWTFTFREVLDVEEACRRWSRFLGSNTQRTRCLLAAYPLIAGIRVYEMHPGTEAKPSHGLHVHAVVDGWLSLDVVRPLWEHYAGERSRLHVVKCGAGAAFYLGKYLTKCARVEALSGRRLWSAFGMADGTRCRDIVVQNEWTESYKFLCATIHGFRGLPWGIRLRMAQEFAHGATAEEALKQFGYTLEEEDHYAAGI